MTEQPYVEMFLVSRDDIEDARRALLYVCASTARGGKGLAKEAESRFFAAHERLSEILRSSPHTADGDRPREKNTDESKPDIE